MKELFELALHAEDERVKSVRLVSDRAGIRGIDFDPAGAKDERSALNPRDYSPVELGMIEETVKLIRGRIMSA